MSDGLKAKHRAAIIATLAANDRVERAVLFGSRAMGTNTITSDVDIALFGQQLTLTDQASLAAACEELPMAQSVDLVLHSAIDNPALVEHIRSYGVEWYRRGGTFKSIDDVCLSITSGGTPSRRNSSFYKDGSWPWVKTKELQDGWLSDSEEHITDEAIALSSAKILPKHTVLMAMYGATVGQLGILQFPMTCNQACCAMILDPDLANYRYLFYRLLHARQRIKSLATGAAQQNLNSQVVKSLEFNFPPLREQETIAHILGTLDDKIELNHRMNETLEAMARALFKDWFVDFGPVRAKAEGREAYLPEEIWGVFPDSFEDSELGEIPRGWGVCSVGDLLTLERDSLTPGNTPEEIFSHYSIPAFDNGMLPEKESGRSIKSNKYLIGDGVFLVSKLNPRTPRVWLPSENGIIKKICSTEFLVCRPSESIGIPFGYCLAKSSSIVKKMSDLASGTSNSHQRVRPADFTYLSVVRPDNKLLSLFNQQILPLLHKSLQIREEKFLMGECRDVLLPKLISGEIHVGEAEKVVEVTI